ncbi:hypothetical protein D3C79_850690 [compost metagenome]
MVYPATLLQLHQQRVALLVVGPDTQLVDAAADHFGGAVAGQPAEAIVDFHIATAVALGDGDGVRAGVKCLGELLFTGLERRFGPLLLGYIAQGRDAAGLVVDADQPAGNHTGQW